MGGGGAAKPLCADGEVAVADADVEAAVDKSEKDGLSWGAGEGAIAIAALIMSEVVTN